MAELNLEINPAQIREVELMFAGIQNSAVKVLTRAINKTLTGARTDMTDEAYQELNTTKTVIRSSIVVEKASWANLTGKTSRAGKPLSLAKFTGTAQRVKGVSVKVLRSGKRSILGHAFIATMKSGHVGVFWRKDDTFVGYADKPKLDGLEYGRLPEKYRLPIKELFGPRVEDILAKAERWENVESKANARLLKNMEAEIAFELSRL